MELLISFSKTIINAFDFIDFNTINKSNTSDIEKAYIQCKENLLFASKIEILTTEIGRLSRSSNNPRMVFNRAKAHNIKAEKKLDLKANRTFFG